MFALSVLLVPSVSPANGGSGEEPEAELYHTPMEKALGGEWTMISRRVAFAGLVEVEVFWEDVDGVATSDILLSTAQLGFKGFVSDELTALLVVEFEEDEDEQFQIDEGTLDYERGLWMSRLGIQDVTFGYYPSHFITGPLTEDLGETKETAILAGFVPEGIAISAWVANGDADKAGKEDQIDDYGLSIIVTPVEEIEFGASFISDLADTDAELVGDSYSKKVAGASAFLLLNLGGLELIGEYLTAAGKFDPADLDEEGDGTGNGVGDTPSAWNAEIALEFQEDLELAARVGGSDEFFDEPEIQYGLCLSYGIWEGVSLSLEYLHDEFDSAWSEDRERDTVTAQLGAEF